MKTMKTSALIFFGIIFAAALFVGCKKEAPVTPERTTLPVEFRYTAVNPNDTADIYYSFGGDTVHTTVIGGQWSISAEAPIGKIAYIRAVGRVHGFSTKIEVDMLGKFVTAHSGACNQDKSISREIKDWWNYSYVIGG